MTLQQLSEIKKEYKDMLKFQKWCTCMFLIGMWATTFKIMRLDAGNLDNLLTYLKENKIQYWITSDKLHVQ